MAEARIALGPRIGRPVRPAGGPVPAYVVDLPPAARRSGDCSGSTLAEGEGIPE